MTTTPDPPHGATPVAAEPDPALVARLATLSDLLTPHAIRVAVTLELADAIAGGTATAAELATRTGAHPGALGSLLAHLASIGVLEITETGALALTPLGELLRHPHARTTLHLRGAAAQMDLAWAGLAETVATGGPSYHSVQGHPFWEHLASDPELSASFDDYMTAASAWRSIAAPAPVWPTSGTLVDVGGGTGELLVEILLDHPDLDGILVDLDGPADRARRHLATNEVADRIRIHTGSFFDPLPAAADAYVLAHILHDWPDAEACQILQRVSEAARPAGRIILIEQIPDTERPSSSHTRSDLLMRNLFGAHERTLDQWRALADRCGLALVDVYELDDLRSILELTVRTSS